MNILRRGIIAAQKLLLGGNDSNTVLLLNCNGDVGNTGHDVTVNGTVGL